MLKAKQHVRLLEIQESINDAAIVLIKIEKELKTWLAHYHEYKNKYDEKHTNRLAHYMNKTKNEFAVAKKALRTTIGTMSKIYHKIKDNK
jgi:hypothetical protein